MGHNIEIRRLILEKLLRPDGPSVASLCGEYGLDQSTVYRWVRSAKNGSMAGHKRKGKISLLEKQKALVEAGKLGEAELGHWLRSRGLQSGTLKQWQDEIDSALIAASRPAIDKSVREIKALQKELLRKDRALAEVSALLVLKKKLASILGEDTEP